ncbi:probable ATP-dependent RNA helicase DDX10 [Anopheles maculipalpis]|uniref:probable ATP-dependent RNA helicase DDX10 n=1 Tax=Anopheles maculipalpis TaxID=1496333 RepID=UPI002159A57A|nr:probable ATP-dependent RNA helicase DDX10 [Anopheles maculipalpis]
MGKIREGKKYVNYARQNKFKANSVRRKTADVNSASQDEEQQFKFQQPKLKRSKLYLSVSEEEEEIKTLRQQYGAETTRGSTETFDKFSDFPLSRKTLAGLNDAEYTKPTVVQRESIFPALCGKDIVAAAKTGSGKTLAFLIPILERLFVEKWTRMDGLGALVITPTRELATQIYETAAQVGKHHDFTVGLLIGGQNLKLERNRLHNLNIIIGTPGRLLQHMDENPLFDTTNLKILVLDEADRCLDMGFSVTMNSIIENLPEVRQTLLFSATQTNSVRELARVNLVNPARIAPHEHEQNATPAKLQQSYVVVDLSAKLTMLWSFLYTHPKQKIIVFFATCKQVKYFYHLFRKLRPASLLLPLYGGMNQEKRNKIYAEFCQKKTNVCLLATDVASRGLDFPKVNWVVQMDCPEDVVQYIHRAGRTARLNTTGENLLVLLPHEEDAMLQLLTNSKIPIKQIKINDRQLFSPLAKIESLLAQFPDLKESAKRAFVAYIKSVALMKNREVFQLQSINLDEFARSLGLSITPRVRFLSRTSNVKGCEKPKLISNFGTTATSIVNGDSSDEEDFLQVKRIDNGLEQPKTVNPMHVEENAYVTTDTPLGHTNGSRKRLSKHKLIKKSLQISKRTAFDDDGIPITPVDDKKEDYYDFTEARLRLEQQDIEDKKRYKAIKKAKRITIKEKERQLKSGGGDVDRTATLADDFGSESDGSVNLDWLPDPDKVYGTKYTENNGSECEPHSNNIEMPHSSKRKRKLLQNARDLTLTDTEQLVMNLLK